MQKVSRDAPQTQVVASQSSSFSNLYTFQADFTGCSITMAHSPSELHLALRFPKADLGLGRWLRVEPLILQQEDLSMFGLPHTHVKSMAGHP